MKAVDSVNKETISEFSIRYLHEDQYVATDAYPSLTALAQTPYHMPEVTPTQKVDDWLPWVHIVISNFKRFILGTYHGVSSKYLQEYINNPKILPRRQFEQRETYNDKHAILYYKFASPRSLDLIGLKARNTYVRFTSDTRSHERL